MEGVLGNCVGVRSYRFAQIVAGSFSPTILACYFSVDGTTVLLTETMTAKLSALGENAAVQATFAHPPQRSEHAPSLDDDAFQVDEHRALVERAAATSLP